MNRTKPWYQSRTVWAGAVSAATGIGALFGVHVPADQTPALTDALLGLTVSISGLVAIYGRVVANSKIS